ncbi:hypothetical protein VH567_11515 [Sphingomonas sp. 4RDLI-65]
MQGNIERDPAGHGDPAPHRGMTGLLVGAVGGAAVWGLATLIVLYLI